jgi:hypothetical protein
MARDVFVQARHSWLSNRPLLQPEAPHVGALYNEVPKCGGMWIKVAANADN